MKMGLNSKDVKLAWKLVAQHQEEFLQRWYHPSKMAEKVVALEKIRSD